MKKILCPTDFSDVANNAIAYAGKFANEFGAELTLLNVKSIYDLVPAGLVGSAAAVNASIKEQLEDQCEEVNRVFKIYCKADYQISGIPLAASISAKAKEYDLIIMGTNGPDDLYEFFAGSNTYNVIKKASVPVLLIPGDCTYSNIDLIVYAFDYFHENKLSVKQLLSIAGNLKSKVRVLQVLDEIKEKNSDKEIHEMQESYRKQDHGDVDLQFDFIYSSNVIESIDKYATRNGNSLALCTRHHSLIQKIFHEDVIKTFSAIASYPLFIFHE